MGRHRRLIVCADDYALTPGVSEGIRNLLSRQRISATSVMAASSFWAAEAAALRDCAGTASIGLHITLTDQVPLGRMPVYAPADRLPPLGSAFKAGLLRRLPLAEIRTEIERQLQSFVAHYGRPPSHIDGHHHIHQLPGIREIVIDVARSIKAPVWVRVSRDRPAAVIKRGVAGNKALLIGALGRKVARLAADNAIATNRGFTGVYDVIGPSAGFADLVPRMLRDVGDGTLFMCHPGIVGPELAALDAMTGKREDEYRYLMSDAWPALLTARGLQLAPNPS